MTKSLPASVTTDLGAITSFGFSFARTAEELHRFASTAHLIPGGSVSAGPQGWTVAELVADGESFVMTRRDATDKLSTHTLLIAATDPERLLAHWRGFVETAMADHAAFLARRTRRG